MPPLIYPSPEYYIKDGTLPANFTFEHVDVKGELLTALKQVLPTKNYADVKVLRADPTLPTEIPCIGLNRVSDDETKNVIADVIGEPTYNRETKEYTVLKGTYFVEMVEIRIWHTNADIRDTLYPLVKSTVFAVRDALVYKGLREVTIKSGKDEQDSTLEHFPVPIYWASLTLSYLNPLNLFITSIEQPIQEGDGVPSGTMTTP